MKKVTVILPTTGDPTVADAIKSVLNQSYENTELYVVVDGPEYQDDYFDVLYDHNLNEHPKYFQNCLVTFLVENVGKGYYGHRVFASFPHLVNSDYVLFLDQDCWYDENHVETMINTIESNNLDWCYSLRKIVNNAGEFVCNDECESLGKWNPVMQYNHVDTNCFCIKTEVAIKICQVWHGKWAADRVFYNAMNQHFPNYDCTGKYTVNYRLGGNEGSVTGEFFKEWNKKTFEMYNGEYPWEKK